MRRISSAMQHDDVQHALRRQESQLQKISNQLGSQKKIENLRDDPIAAGHSVRYKSYLARLERFDTNTKTLIDRFSVTETYMNQSLQIMQRVRELAVAGANGTFTQDDLRLMAPEIDELLQELVLNGNAIGPDGTRIFAGTKSFTEPFEIVYGDVDGAGNPMIKEVRYRGSHDGNEIEIDESSYMATGQNGSRTFWAEKQSLFSSVDATSFIVPTDTTIYVDGVAVPLATGDNVYAVISKINDSGAAVKASLDPVTNGLNIETTDIRQLWLSDGTGDSVLSSLGLIKEGQEPPYNIASTVRVSGSSLYGSVIALRDALLAGDHESIGGRILGSVDGAIDNLTTRMAEIGARYERAQNTVARIQTQILNVTAQDSREMDIDLSEAITDQKMYELVQKVTLSSAGKLYQNSLLNYLR